MAYSSVERSDEELMLRAARGDEDALAVLVRRYEAPLYRYLYRMLGNGADAEDMFQETFLRVHRHRTHYRVSAPFRPWLYQIATNLCRDRLRYRRRHPQVSLDAPCGPDADDPPTVECTKARQVDPLEAARRTEATARLEHALDELPGKQKAVFLMARYENMPYDEIARSLNVPVGTVKSRMNKAVHYLMQAVRDIWP